MPCSCLRDALTTADVLRSSCGPDPRSSLLLLGGIDAPQNCARLGTSRIRGGLISARLAREGQKMDRLYYVIGIAAVTAAIFTVLGSW
jgi:hypothetical protein